MAELLRVDNGVAVTWGCSQAIPGYDCSES